MYVSTITLPGGVEIGGCVGRESGAAEEAGFTPQYDMTDIQPDETKTFTLAAYGPRGTARRIVLCAGRDRARRRYPNRRAGPEHRVVDQRGQHHLHG